MTLAADQMSRIARRKTCDHVDRLSSVVSVPAKRLWYCEVTDKDENSGSEAKKEKQSFSLGRHLPDTRQSLT